MKCIRTLFLALFCIPVLVSNGQVRSVQVLTEGWKFSRLKQDGILGLSFNDKNWQTVSVPHDWAIYGPFDKEIDKQVVAIEQNGEKVATEKTGRTGSLPYIGEGWYRKEFELPDFNAGKKVILLFEGAMSEPQVYINGTKVGEWNYGYSYFYFDITNQVRPGYKNLLSVHLNNKGESSRWYPGAGLYRKVSVIVKNEESIDQWGTYITTPSVTAGEAKVKIKTRASAPNSFLVTDIIDDQGKRVASDTIRKNFNNEFEQDIAVMQPRFWSPETPVLYRAISRLYTGNELKDEVSTVFGIRTISYTADKGFQLNGVTRKFKGFVCITISGLWERQ
ncbi:sugar-binding domain-containing protein [Niabella hibiscisoli]|uniref:sugar-binding domain-containing protein n=1 Tax=Niabella hibiscisoli TaxID=1825928 RepID=UPI001F10C1C9|nr:sugar-binding domain-containing protein [Niabella hibiscisoli]MCH5718318.1 hypothetical protein [Niabella hibiscisoli]